MNKDTPIIVASAQAIGLALLGRYAEISYATVMIILLLGTIYYVWSFDHE